SVWVAAKLVGSLYTCRERRRRRHNPPRQEAIMPAVPLTPEQELQAQALAARLRQAVEADILQLARLLVSKPEEQIFGQTEFEVRDLVPRLGATALQTHLAEKKTATTAPASSARTVAKPRSSTATARKRR